MDNQNLSDIIESYLKKVLHQHEQVDIRRSEVAERFNCVPSQINYVIKTRFTIQHGYVVESKRGGGGYIRIIKVQLLDEMEKLGTLIDIIGQKITERDAFSIVNTLYEEKIISHKEAKLMLAALEKSNFNAELKNEEKTRASILKNMLLCLKYELPQ